MVERRNIINVFKVTVSREFNFPLEIVFDEWLDTKNLGKWFFSTPEGVDKVSDVDPRVGGDFRIGERRGEEMAMHVGTFHEIDRPKRIVFSYYMETANDDALSNVIIDFEKTENGCRVLITHEMDDVWSEYEELTIQGWNMIFDGLEKVLN